MFWWKPIPVNVPELVLSVEVMKDKVCSCRAARVVVSTSQAQDIVKMREYQDQDQDFIYQREITTN